MSTHKTPHPLAGKTVKITTGQFAGRQYWIEDWWDRVAGKSWMDCDGNPACMEYAVRSASEGTVLNNDVVYGKFDIFAKLIHINQLGNVLKT